jgi:hypothetical protein
LETSLGNLLNADWIDLQLVTTGIPLEISLGKLIECEFDIWH